MVPTYPDPKSSRWKMRTLAPNPNLEMPKSEMEKEGGTTGAMVSVDVGSLIGRLWKKLRKK